MTNPMGMEQRVQRLERECRVLRGGLALGAIGLLGIGAMGQTTSIPKVLQAETFQVVDSKGAVLVGLGVDERMRSALKFYAENGKPQVALGANSDGGGSLAFVDRGERLTVVLGSHPDRGAAFGLHGGGERHGVFLTADDKGAGLNVGDGRVTLTMGATDGNGEFCIAGAGRKLSASMTRFKDGDVCLKLWDKDGTLFHCVPEGSHPAANPK